MSDQSMEYDVIVVGGGPAGLAAAIRLKQLAIGSSTDISVCLLDKGAEIGSHILSGAVIDTRALDELIPDWLDRAPSAGIPVEQDEFHFLTGPATSVRVPRGLVPGTMHNARSERIVSLGHICTWLGEEASRLEIDIFPGFAAAEMLFDDAGRVTGVATGDVGRDKSGVPKESFQAGIRLFAKYTIVAEGARGHLARGLIDRFDLDDGRDPQHYAIGLKELWQVDNGLHSPGRVIHGAGWPLGREASGGFFAYHAADATLAIGLIVDLNYRNPWLDPFREFQRLKQHPMFAATLTGGQRLGFGARAIAKGGLNSLPRMAVPGALLAGCAAGTLNFARIKGTHTAMQSGMIAARAIFEALRQGRSNDVINDHDRAFSSSWAGEELRTARNFGPALHRFGLIGGAAFNFIDQTVLRGRSPFTLHDREADHVSLLPAGACRRIDYPKPDGRLTFDRMTSVYLSGTHHDENQPCHLRLTDTAVPIDTNLPRFAGPEQRYCPAGVYEFIHEASGRRLQINAQNCLHCKVCDIKDPGQNITWVPPEAGGPVYTGM